MFVVGDCLGAFPWGHRLLKFHLYDSSLPGKEESFCEFGQQCKLKLSKLSDKGGLLHFKKNPNSKLKLNPKP